MGRRVRDGSSGTAATRIGSAPSGYTRELFARIPYRRAWEVWRHPHALPTQIKVPTVGHIGGRALPRSGAVRRSDGKESIIEAQLPIMIIMLRDVKRCGFSSGCKSHPANSVAPAGSYRSGGRGNETAEAFETTGRAGGPASRQAVTRVNAEQAPKEMTREPTRQHNGEGRRHWVAERQLS